MMAPALMPEPSGGIMSHDDIRSEITSRLIASSRRWREIGKLSLTLDDSNGHDSIRLADRIMATVSVLRSRAHRDVIDDGFLRKIRGRSATEIACAIADRFPHGRLPGYAG